MRELEATLEDLEMARSVHGDEIEKIFVADGDALVMGMETWRAILSRIGELFPAVRQVPGRHFGRVGKPVRQLVAALHLPHPLQPADTACDGNADAVATQKRTVEIEGDEANAAVMAHLRRVILPVVLST